MDMKKMIQRMTDIENEEKKKLTESTVTECGEEGMPAVSGQPMSVNITASGKENVEELLKMMQAAGLGDAGPVSQDMMPMRQDMDRLRAIVADPHEMEADAAYADEYIADDEGYDNSPDEEYLLPADGGGINKKKGAYAAAERGDNPMAVEEIDPEKLAGLEKIRDIDQLKQVASQMVSKTKMNPKKKMGLLRNIEKSFKTDNIIGLLWNAVLGKEGLHAMGSSWKGRFEDVDVASKDKIKESLLKALAEKKAKPDFLDMDKDGNKKEPMKKAIKDKKKKPFGEAAKPDYIDADGDGDKKEPMKKAFKDKEKKDKKVDEVFYGTDDEWKASVKKTADNVRAQLKKKHEKEKAAKSKEK